MNCKNNEWKDPPKFIVAEGLAAIVRYHSDIEISGSVESWTLKVVVIGAVNAGKSSVVKSLIARKPQLMKLADRTRGVDVHINDPCQTDESQRVQFVFWDFAGHDDYYSTHSMFLSSGALFLLVVDLASFINDPSSRSDAIHIWLDKVVCRTPGAVVQIVATHIDKPRINYEVALQELRKAVRDYLTDKSRELKCDLEQGGLLEQGGQEGERLPALRIIDKILPVSCKDGTKLAELGEELATLGKDGTTSMLSEYSRADVEGRTRMEEKLFPGVGQKVPGNRQRACAVMDALRDGMNPHEAARLDQTVTKLGKPIPCISVEDAEAKWKEVVKGSRTISNEVRGTATTVLQVCPSVLMLMLERLKWFDQTSTSSHPCRGYFDFGCPGFK